MAIQKVTYTDKEDLNIDPTVPLINKVIAADMNEIKSVINNNADELENVEAAPEVMIQTTTPTEGKIWINPNETPSGSLNPITNEYSVATDKGYSCNYLNNANTYSQSEIKTDKVWIDGKPIYRKVVLFQLSSTSGSFQYYSHDIDNIETPISIDMYYFYSGRAYKCCNDAIQELSFGDTNIQYYNTNSYIAGTNAYAILEYTKTTD